MSWFPHYCDETVRTDQLTGNPKHVGLLAAGLFGEAGSVLTELKKRDREKAAYPLYRDRLVEELGDFLWYFARLIRVLDPSVVTRLDDSDEYAAQPDGDDIVNALTLGGATGALLTELHQGASTDVTTQLGAIWRAFVRVAAGLDIDLRQAAEKNREKTRSRWPDEREFRPLFDDGFPEEEQIPRKLKVEFREIDRGDKSVVILRCNGLNIGDRLTDNIENEDCYRFHDVFHFAHAVYLGWSPIVRYLLKCKRKSKPIVDENQDGARAGIIEEAVSATVFSRAKAIDYYDGIDHVDYDLLKTVTEFVRGYEVDDVPLWQWEATILNGYRVFRELRKHRGGKVTLDLLNRNLGYEAPSTTKGSDG